VCLNTIVRKEKVLDSERLRILPMGSRVNVVKQDGRRVRIDQPIVGWCSLNSSNGDTILKPLDNQQQKVAPTPRSGQAAVTNLQNRVEQKAEEINQAKTQGIDTAAMQAEKDQLEARIRDLEQRNEDQVKQLEEWKQAAASANASASGTVPTDMAKIQFRNGDAVLVNSNTIKLEGILVVRCVAENSKGEEVIGCDYAGNVPDDVPGKTLDGSLDGVKKWTPADNMVGVWCTRKNMKSLLPTLSLLQAMEKMEQENTDLKFYKRTAEAMIKKVKEFGDAYASTTKITMDDNEYKGVTYSKNFMKAFTTLEIMD